MNNKDEDQKSSKNSHARDHMAYVCLPLLNIKKLRNK